jgi:hypothetical protein
MDRPACLGVESESKPLKAPTTLTTGAWDACGASPCSLPAADESQGPVCRCHGSGGQPCTFSRTTPSPTSPQTRRYRSVASQVGRAACGVTQDFFKEMKGEERMVVHFYRNANFPCKVRLSSCAPALTEQARVVSPAAVPIARTHHRRTFATHRGRLVLKFGGDAPTSLMCCCK